MKTPEDEAFDELARKQGAWGGGFKAKQAMAADKLQEPEREALKLALEALEAMQMYAAAERKGLRICDEAITAIKEALAQPAQEPVAFAGIEIWVGGERITKHLTQTELHYARDPWMLMQYSAELCLAKLKERNHGT